MNECMHACVYVCTYVCMYVYICIYIIYYIYIYIYIYMKEERTPLHLAAIRGHGKIVEALVEAKADLRATDKASVLIETRLDAHRYTCMCSLSSNLIDLCNDLRVLACRTVGQPCCWRAITGQRIRRACLLNSARR